MPQRTGPTTAGRTPGAEPPQSSPRHRSSEGGTRGNLGAEVTRFLGRDEELEAVAALAADVRLLSLTGPPGIGKSRLAVEAARELAPRYPDGVWLVELAAVTDADAVAQAAAAVLSLEEAPGQSVVETLVTRLSQQQALLILDNCEHLLAACAELAGALLHRCPDLTIIATTREPLELAGETIWQVPPLPVPGSAEESPDRLMSYGAVQLFVERARAARPSFSLTADVAPAVAEVCRGLDGIPLAIELAATRVDALTPGDIARRLDDRFKLLRRGARSGLLVRHQTLHAALESSHDLLSVAERALLRRLSVFAGYFDLEAAEAVCTGEEIQSEDVFDILASLIVKSLVVAETSDGSRARYRLLETIRVFARERLEEVGETKEYRGAHARWYVELAGRAEDGLTGPEQSWWLQRLESERENLRCALEWLLDRDEADTALRLAANLILFWRAHSHFTEGRELLLRPLARADGAAPELRAKGVWGLGFLALMAGDYGEAMPALEDSLERFREIGDPKGCARALLILGNASEFRDPAAGLGQLQESAALAKESGDHWCLAHALGCAAIAHRIENDLRAARESFEQGLAVARQAQDHQGMRFNLIGLGSTALEQGDYRRAEAALEEALMITRELKEDYDRATALRYLGDLALRRGNYARARELFEQCLSLMRAVRPSPEELAGPLDGLARVAHAEGERRRAQDIFDEAISLFPSDERMPPQLLQGLAEVHAQEGKLQGALRLAESARDFAFSRGFKARAAEALHTLGQLARESEDDRRAAALHHEALQLRRDVGDAHGIAESLEAVAGLAATAGQHQHAARLFGAANALRQENGYVRQPWAAARYEADVALIREALAAGEMERSYAQGAGLPIEELLIQATKGRGRRPQPASGWDSLTDVEKQVAQLVADGLTNPEIAERLFLGLGTVKDHVSRLFSKLGVSGRRQLAREVRASVRLDFDGL